MSGEEDDLSFGTESSDESRDRSRSPSVSRHRSATPSKGHGAKPDASRANDGGSSPRRPGSSAPGGSRDSHERRAGHAHRSPLGQSAAVESLSPAPRAGNTKSSASPKTGGDSRGGAEPDSPDRSPRDDSKGDRPARRRRDAEERNRSPENGNNRASDDPGGQGSEPWRRGSAGRRDNSERQDKSGRGAGHSSHAPLLSSLGTSKAGQQQRSTHKARDREPRREEKDTRNAPLTHMRDGSGEPRHRVRGSRNHTSEDRGAHTGRSRRDRDGRSGRDESTSQPRGGKSHRPGPSSRVEEHRRPPTGNERYQQDRNTPMRREAHNSFITSHQPDRHTSQRPPKRSRDREPGTEGDARSAVQPRSVPTGPHSQPPPPPPRKAALPPPPPVPSTGRNGSSGAADHSGHDVAVHQAGGGRRRRTGWEPAQPVPAHPAEALRSVPMPETRECGTVRGMQNDQDLPGPPVAAPVSQGAPPPDQPAAKNFGLSGVLAADTKRNEGGHVQKYAEPADAAVPGPGWRLYIYKGDQNGGKDCSCGPPIRLSRGNQTFWTLGKDKRVCHVLAMHPSTSREHVAVQFRRTVKGEITPYAIDLDSSNGTYLRNQAEDVAEGIHGGGYDKLDPGRYYRIYSGDVLRLGESQRDYVFIVDDANQN